MSQKPDEAQWTDTVVMTNAGRWDSKLGGGVEHGNERAARNGSHEPGPTPSPDVPPLTRRG